MRLYLLPLPVFVLSVLGQGLQINVTSPVECDRKSHKGDVISVNYRGTFTNGTEFDSSASYHVYTPSELLADTAIQATVGSRSALRSALEKSSRGMPFPLSPTITD